MPVQSLMPRRALGIAQAVLGAVLLAVPDRVSAAIAAESRPCPDWLVRLLGARMLGQGCLIAAQPTDGALQLGTAVEAVHGTSMIVAAGLAPQFRRSALASACLAALWTLLDLAAQR